MVDEEKYSNANNEKKPQKKRVNQFHFSYWFSSSYIRDLWFRAVTINKLEAYIVLQQKITEALFLTVISLFHPNYLISPY